jgi:thiol-disulfide isomerase/thioredoxin
MHKTDDTFEELTMKKRLIHLSMILVALFLIISCSSNESHDQAKASSSRSAQAATVPITQFAAYDLDGNLQQSSQWIGKQPVVINVWGTWCPPCRREIPDLVKLYNEYNSRGVEMIGLAVVRNEPPSSVRQFAQQNDMKWEMLLADQNIATIFGLQAVPTTIFVDRNGNIVPVTDGRGQTVDRFTGMQSYEVFKAAFEKMLKS